MDQSQAQQQMVHFLAVMMPLMFLFGLVMVALIIIPLWRICTKAGLSGPLSLISLIPGVGWLITVYIIAFSDWKVVPVQSFPYPPPYPSQPQAPGPYAPVAYPQQAVPHPHAQHPVESFPAAGYPPQPPPVD